MKRIRVKKFKRSKKRINVDFSRTEDNEKIKDKDIKKLSRLNYLKIKKDKGIALILRKNKSAIMIQIPNKIVRFSIDNNTYFNVQSGCYNLSPKHQLISVYLEGCCLPIEHRYITYEKHIILLTDKNGDNVKEITEDVDRKDVPLLPKDNKGNFLKNENGFIIKKQLDRIKGLEFDSTIANTIFDSGLIEEVRPKGKPEKFFLLLLIIVVINIILTIGAIISTRV